MLYIQLTTFLLLQARIGERERENDPSDGLLFTHVPAICLRPSVRSVSGEARKKNERANDAQTAAGEKNRRAWASDRNAENDNVGDFNRE